MKIDGFPGETELFSFKLTNGSTFVTTLRIIIERENPNQGSSADIEWEIEKIFRQIFLGAFPVWEESLKIGNAYDVAQNKVGMSKVSLDL